MRTEHTHATNRPAPPRSKKTSVRTAALLCLAGALAAYAASWVGPFAFYHQFQKRFDDGRLGVPGGVLRTFPIADAAEAPAPAGCIVRDGVRFPLPEGTLREFLPAGDVFVAVLDEGRVQYQRLPPDFVRTLYRNELEHIGDTPAPAADEIALFDAIARVTPAAFRFNWPAPARNAYAASLMTKLLLWEDRPVRAMHAHDELHGRSVLVLYADGSAKCVTRTPQATLVIRMGTEAPARWKASARQWIPRPYDLPPDE